MRKKEKSQVNEKFQNDFEDTEKTVLSNNKETVDDDISEEVDKIDSEIEELKKSNEELLDRLQRSLAEFDNFRKRTIKEKGQMFDDGVREAIDKLLPVLDNLERAVETFDNKEDNTYKGFEMILRQLLSVFETMGVKRIESVGEKFNTDYHYAVSHVKDDNCSENEVVEELQKGYIYKDKVIRCSMVKVAN